MTGIQDSLARVCLSIA